MKILGLDFTLDFSMLDAELAASGRMVMNNQKIYVARDLCTQSQSTTLLHEIIEVLNFSLGLNLPHQSICNLEVGLFPIFEFELKKIIENHKITKEI